jgi:uncharacterized protein (DUF4415 family)
MKQCHFLHILIPCGLAILPGEESDFPTFRLSDFPQTVIMGRPRKETTKELVSIRIDAHALNALRATGAGWQTRLSEHIAEWATQL